MAPYLDIDGVAAAALVATDGLLVVSTGATGLDLEALAAYGASALESARGLATELDLGLPRNITIDLSGRGLLLAPVAEGIFLMLISEPGCGLPLFDSTFPR